MTERVDILVVGAGPAGMAAATMAAEEGLSVAVIDEHPSAGGQIYRGLKDGPFRHASSLGSDYTSGSALIARFTVAKVTTLLGASLWRVDVTDDGGIASYSKDGRSQRLAFHKLVLATGAIERPVAFEGWTLPGVMSVGGAQLLLKTSAIAPAGRIALAGNGPLVLLFATQLLALGVQISAVLDTAPKTGLLKAVVRNGAAIIRNGTKVRKGLRMLGEIRAAKVPVYGNVSSVLARGTDHITSIAFETDGKRMEIGIDSLLVHEGIIPNTQLSRALKCRHIWDDRQKCLRPDVDRFGESSVPGIFIVGDGATITGAIAAPASAEVAVGRIVKQMARASDRSQATARKAAFIVARERAFRPFLDELYPPRISVAALSGDTIVCRCEEVTGREIRSAIRDGAIGPAQAKAFTRCGMGPCQGRMCSPIVSRLIASETNRTVDEVDTYNIRFPLKPMTVSEMAQCGESGGEGDTHHAV